VVEQNSPYSDLDNYDQKALHIWLEYKGEIVAYCRVFPPNIKYTEASIGRVVCQPKYRGENWGRKLMLKAIATVENEFETTAIRISAQDYLLNFYQSLGFSPTDKKYLEDGLPHTEMVKK
jgi:ElaA protein